MKTHRGWIENYIRVRFQYDGFHRWRDAPEEVAFLKNMHRHLFKCEAIVQVNAEDRELEFFMVLNNIQKNILPHVLLGDGTESCETMANRILKGLIQSYGKLRKYEVTVTEDGENGAISKYEPETPW